jgi:hypothetical protein
MTCGVHSRLRLSDEANSIQKDERSLPYDSYWTNRLGFPLTVALLKPMHKAKPMSAR